jgi:chaperone modulatory protein CbpM
MQADTEWTWLDPRESVDLPELAGICRLEVAEVLELVEYGALVPLPQAGAQRRFSGACVPPLREAARLRADLDLDLFTVSLLLRYLQRIDDLEHQVRSLQAQLRVHVV